MRAPGLDKLVFVATAVLFGGAAGGMYWRVVSHHASNLVKPVWLCVAIALLCLLATLLHRSRFQRFLRGCAILVLNTTIVFGAAEAGGRLMGIDYNELLQMKQKNERFPVYFRVATRPVGEVFFTREGPMEWKGRPLHTLEEIHKSTDKAYEDEKEVTIRYSSEGFRNPEGLKDWQLVVVGDSFTEAGYLPDDEIFPSLAAKALGVTAKNLGISDTGTYSQAFYLKTYGKAPSCKQAVLVFFEGNDIEDDAREREELKAFRETGKRPSHEIEREPSLIRTIYHIARDSDKITFRARSYANAFFLAGGKKLPVTIADAPPAPEDMTPDQKSALTEGLALWAATCKEQGVEPWLLYIPCKRRVYDGRLEKAPDYPNPGWRMNDLPAYVAAECRAQRINVVDSTPALVEAAAKGVPTYNPIYDTHLNREGHQIVAKVLSTALTVPPSEIRPAEVTASAAPQ